MVISTCLYPINFYSGKIYSSVTQVDETGIWPKLPKLSHCQRLRFSVSVTWVVSLGWSQKGLVSGLVQFGLQILVEKQKLQHYNRQLKTYHHLPIGVSASLSLSRLISLCPELLSWSCCFRKIPGLVFSPLTRLLTSSAMCTKTYLPNFEESENFWRGSVSENFSEEGFRKMLERILLGGFMLMQKGIRLFKKTNMSEPICSWKRDWSVACGWVWRSSTQPFHSVNNGCW